MGLRNEMNGIWGVGRSILQGRFGVSRNGEVRMCVVYKDGIRQFQFLYFNL